MLKGVHHQIVEIRQTDDPYFERALLFVRADCASRPTQGFEQAGKQFVKAAGSYSELRRNRLAGQLRRVVCVIGGGVLGSFLTFLLQK